MQTGLSASQVFLPPCQVQFLASAVEVPMRLFLLTVGCLCALLKTAAAEQSYKLVGQIPIGGEGGWDIVTIDSAAHRLYLSHATKVVVVDLEKNAVAGEIT